MARKIVCSIFVLLVFAVSAVAEQESADFIKRMLAGFQPGSVLGWGEASYRLNDYRPDDSFSWVAVRDEGGCLVFSFEYWVLDIHRRRINAVKLISSQESFIRAWNATEVNDLARAETRAEVKSNGTCGKEIDLSSEVDKFNGSFSSFMVMKIVKKL